MIERCLLPSDVQWGGWMVAFGLIAEVLIAEKSDV